jgi:26S proteasome regulatory subunit N5
LAEKPAADSPKPAESLQTASDLLQELQVETYSSMELREKIEILLEQMRVLMLVARIKDEQAAAAGGLADGEADWVKMKMGSRKVNETFVNKPDNKVGSINPTNRNNTLITSSRFSKSSSMS